MLQALFIEENKEKVIEGLKKRYFLEIEGMLSIIKKILYLLDDKRRIQLKRDAFFFSFNKISRQINKLIQIGKNEKAIALYDKYNNLKKDLIYRKTILSSVSKELLKNLLSIPNIPHEYIKKGYSSKYNEIIYNHGKINLSTIKKLSHWEFSKKMELINCELGAKISGSGFTIYKGKVARLHRAMIEYFIEYNLQGGYIEYAVPFLVRPVAIIATGQIPDKEKQMYYLEKDNLYLISTGEIPLMNCYREIILKESQLPIKITAYTPCFRREAGSYGANVRGLNRLHQFDKVEIIQITTPDFSYYALQEMVQHVKNILISLNLPFRLLRLCGGDMGFTSAITYDFEIYSYTQNQWLEVSSISNCTNFQSNRLKLRYKKTNRGKTQICHSLNGSSIAVQRILAVLLENSQTSKSIEIPETLIPYTGFKEILFSSYQI
ncbi:seryl-tRNA synthetase [Candidatus Uzinura diaspidicola str. ASNER]|uniref:Serine--tRNA ligase n=1 Tax=Candidatus Uzinura diaspidicola str. ASNER TaxID=1133592 RepID=L7VJI8_9FLAO|nr:seryl-tRNA synthetase [Candidatus Uzinura diaspidicola str. ASNER]